MTAASERAARVGRLRRPAAARAAVVRMHDGAQAGIGSLAQLAGCAALLLAATVGMQQQASRALRRDSGIARLQRRARFQSHCCTHLRNDATGAGPHALRSDSVADSVADSALIQSLIHSLIQP